MEMWVEEAETLKLPLKIFLNLYTFFLQLMAANLFELAYLAFLNSN